MKDYTLYIACAYALTAAVLMALVWRSLAARNVARRGNDVARCVMRAERAADQAHG